MPVIEVHGVTRRYGEGPPALGDLTLTVEPGEAVAILGPSGSGKSTLLNLIAALDRPDSGTVTVAGVSLDRIGEAAAARYRRAHIGMIFQFFNLLDDLSVAENVVLPARLAGMGRAEAARRAATLLEALGIDRHASAYPGRLSGGERQRVAVARALVNRPALLLADEPTGELDEDTGAQIAALFDRVHGDGTAIVVVTHNPAVAARAGRHLVMKSGRVVST